MKFIIEKSKDGQFFFTLRARNGQTITVSETYKTKQACKKAIDTIKRNIYIAKTIDLTK